MFFCYILYKDAYIYIHIYNTYIYICICIYCIYIDSPSILHLTVCDSPGPHRQGLPPGTSATHRPGAAALRVTHEATRCVSGGSSMGLPTLLG